MSLDQLHTAIEQGDAVAIRRLIRDCPADLLNDGDGLMSYTYFMNQSVIPILVDEGVDVDQRNSCNGTVLASAAGNGDLAMVRWLLEHGADVNAQNDECETPFSFACAYDHREVAEALRHHGANVNCVHRAGGTPLDNRCHTTRIQEFLISIGAKRESEL